MEEQSQQAGPPSPSFLTLVLKTFAGLGGGIAGMVILLIIFLGASTILNSVFNPDLLAETTDKSPLFIFVFMAMIFLTSLGANLLGSLFFTFVEHEKYSRTSTAMYQVFFANLVIFIILAPVYLLLDSRNLMDMVGFLAGFQALIGALASMMILEIIGNLRYALVGVYGVIFAMLIGAASIILTYELTQNNTVIVLFSTLPVIWTLLGFVTVIVEMLYRWLYTLYGSDFLMSKTSFGRDYGEPEVEEAPPPPDVTGAEFLNK
ncbi:hypothetical protein HZC21_01515 [Candidatus Peregrinibacteria bacterium]|nr:hypothetical protein [Candidatus Peregrinibacteria bacterium]